MYVIVNTSGRYLQVTPVGPLFHGERRQASEAAARSSSARRLVEAGLITVLDPEGKPVTWEQQRQRSSDEKAATQEEVPVESGGGSQDADSGQEPSKRRSGRRRRKKHDQ